MENRVKLNAGESLKFVSCQSKGFMAEEDINEYSVIDAQGNIVGKVVHRDHTAVNGFRRTQSVLQTDADGKVVVDVGWSGD
ncbi:hypothetical protein V0R50_10640 [Pseudomonas sp. 148P]|uniref:Uncharacterized protein n=1 Tax=Pseudomonas ulcerans TaxID=3115852 RepID=A0ABU7HQC4_9PSED|nr:MULTISPECIES: hypothetical protein [unclassified Pseudomonas]MEE1922701.1 hypothetical protein [Pseudomonas sp. 147P]MEE1933678.1 hypothetical protein [Pseudomonas sp. 148P]